MRIMRQSTKAFYMAKRAKGAKREFFSKFSRALDLEAFAKAGGETQKWYESTKVEGGYIVQFKGDDTVYYVGGGKVVKIEMGKVKVQPAAKDKSEEQPKDKSKPAEGGGEGRPTEPGEGGCGESPAMSRARAIFNCIFSGPPQVAPDGTPGPASRPTGPSGPAVPKDCNEVNMAAIWGSSTSQRGGATDPEGPEDLMPAGPAIPKGFIPKIHGAIDPPKGSVALPGGKDIPGGGWAARQRGPTRRQKR